VRAGPGDTVTAAVHSDSTARWAGHGVWGTGSWGAHVAAHNESSRRAGPILKPPVFSARVVFVCLPYVLTRNQRARPLLNACAPASHCPPPARAHRCWPALLMPVGRSTALLLHPPLSPAGRLLPPTSACSLLCLRAPTGACPMCGRHLVRFHLCGRAALVTG